MLISRLVSFTDIEMIKSDGTEMFHRFFEGELITLMKGGRICGLKSARILIVFTSIRALELAFSIYKLFFF